MRNSFKKVQYLLLALSFFALTGCGATSTTTAANPTGNTTKLTAKVVGLLSDSVATVRLQVTGAAIPTARQDFAGKTGGTIEVYPGSSLIVTAQAFDATNVMLSEGAVTDVTVVAGTPTTVTITMNPSVVKTADATCLGCHETTRDTNGQNLVADYKQSGHYTNTALMASKNGSTQPGCAGCHGTSHNDLNPAASGRCADCHTSINPNHAAYTGGSIYTCGACHITHNTTLALGGCIGCHSVGQNAPAGAVAYVNDNSGVRAITPEFNKRSHHITGGTPTNAQCIVCHLEGKVVLGAVVVDTAKHMVDASIHLRNADDNTDMQWSGTEHTAMDNFCFSCHDSNGAAGLAAAGLNAVTNGTASNPFGDTLTNGYDQVARAGVVDVKTAFTTSNASHHAVSGQRYKYRFSTLLNAQAWATRTGNPVPDASLIAEGHTDLDGNAIPAAAFEETMTGDFTLDKVAKADGTGKTLPSGSEYLPKGEGEATLYEASKFVATYIPLGATQNVADNSTLHCGDCHTVGQWTKLSSTNADGSKTTVAIGAHGSANEYLLRNSLGTDAIHNNLTYVCFNCHVAGLNVGTLNAAAAGFGQLHPVQAKNQVLGYATTHAVSAFHIQCLADSANNIGATDRLAKSWEADKTYLDYVPSPGATAAFPAGGSDATAGNITGIACTSCHNSALRSGFGGIHGGDNTYVDGFNRTQKSYRFMPGMGNYRYAPPGGWDGKDTAILTPAGKPAGGCYTNSASGDTNPGYSACSHHGTTPAPVGSPTAPGASGPVLGGGTAKAPFTDPAAEYTVREATAGNALVTRPLKY